MAEEALHQEQEEAEETEVIQDYGFTLPSILIEEEETENSEESEETEESETSAEEESGEVSEQEGEDEEVATVTDLIESQGLDPEWFNNLRVPIKVNGQPAEATFQELVNSYQTQEAATQRLDEAKSKAQQLHQAAEQRSEAAQAGFAVVGGLVQAAEKVLERDISEADLKKLREEDPGQYAAAKADFEERRNQINTLKRELLTSYQKNQQSSAAETDAERQERLAKEQEALLGRVPEWADEKVAEAEKTQLVEYLTSDAWGFTPEDLEAAEDHRLFAMARKAMLYDQTKAKANAAEKKVKKVPRMLKPGAQRPAAQKPKDMAEVLYGK